MGSKARLIEIVRRRFTRLRLLRSPATIVLVIPILGVAYRSICTVLCDSLAAAVIGCYRLELSLFMATSRSTTHRLRYEFIFPYLCRPCCLHLR